MSLEHDSLLGDYRIDAVLGAGGMGEVYRATDTKLGRPVAIKLLATEMATDRQRMARLEREARALASLNHPNIAAIHGLYETRGKDGSVVPFLVLELVEGPELGEVIARVPVNVREMLELGFQVAEALEEAHSRGIVHRDLKPANIKVTPEGRVKVLDFGLAKAMAEKSLGGVDSASASMATVTAGQTLPGTVLGTPAYMSPEQARGEAVDHRTDIWAFGALLFEMLAGRRAFNGESVTDVLAAVVKDDPDLAALPPSTPHGIRRLLRRCLEKVPRNRLQSIGDARLELAEVLESGDDVSLREELEDDTVESIANRFRRLLPWAVSAVLGALLMWSVLQRPEKPTPSPATKLSVELSPDIRLAEEALDSSSAVVLSPNEELLAFIGKASGDAGRVYVRSVASLQAEALPGTEAATSPFFSPDGQWIAFFSEQKLRKISVHGGAPVVLADSGTPYGGSWAENGTIAFARQGTPGLIMVNSDGGSESRLTTLDREGGETGHNWPQLLDGGKLVLYTATGSYGRDDNARIILEEVVGGARKVLHQGGFHARYSPSGHLLFMYLGELYAVKLDLRATVADTRLIGTPEPIIEGIRSNSRWGGAQFSISERGSLVYLAGQDGYEAPIHWATRTGSSVMRAKVSDWENAVFSPDGTRLVMSIDGDSWILEWQRGTLRRLTSLLNGGLSVWSPDGTHIISSSRSDATGGFDLYLRRVDGTGTVQPLTQSNNIKFATSWHPSGRFVAIWERSETSNFDIRILELRRDAELGWTKVGIETVVDNEASDAWPAFSADGRFLAFASQMTGRREVYVQTFPRTGAVWRVSIDGGTWPVWSRTRNELLFGTQDGRIMVARYEIDGDTFVPESPELWTDQRFIPGQPDRYFDLHPDGDRVILRLSTGETPTHAVLVTDFLN